MREMRYPIIVRLQPEDRLSTTDLENISVATPGGQVIPVSSLVTKEIGRGPTGINRVNSQRVSYISANLQSGVPLGEAVE
ncbi:MAG: efflux RND transporter permease subunit [Balneolaceae bacterium]|nr:efflux RND transporter permease subunit [Balneolaceae bacterium]